MLSLEFSGTVEEWLKTQTTRSSFASSVESLVKKASVLTPGAKVTLSLTIEEAPSPAYHVACEACGHAVAITDE